MAGRFGVALAPTMRPERRQALEHSVWPPHNARKCNLLVYNASHVAIIIGAPRDAITLATITWRAL